MAREPEFTASSMLAVQQRIEPQLAALQRLALRLTMSHDDADALIRTVVKRLYVHRFRFAQVKDLRPWLFRVTYYQFIAHRYSAQSPAAEEQEKFWVGSANSHAAGPAYCAMSLQLKDYAAEALRQLQRNVPESLDQLSLPEIAQAAGVPLPELKSAITKARNRLREQLNAFELIPAQLPGRRIGRYQTPAGALRGSGRSRRRRNGGGDVQRQSTD